MGDKIDRAYKALSLNGQRAYMVDANAEDPSGRRGTPLTNQKLFNGAYNSIK